MSVELKGLDNGKVLEIHEFDSLAELALDMRWSWNDATDEVWRQKLGIELQEMKQGRPADVSGGCFYSAAVSAARPPGDLIPQFDGVAIPLEDSRILWQK